MKKFNFDYVEFDSWEILTKNTNHFAKAFEKEQFYKGILDKLRDLNKKAMESDGIDLFRDYRFIKAVEIAEERYKYYENIATLTLQVNAAMLEFRNAQDALKVASIA